MHNLLQNAGSSPFPWLWDEKQLSCAGAGTGGAEQLWLLIMLRRAVGSTGLLHTPCRRGNGRAGLPQESPSLSRLPDPDWPRSGYWGCGICVCAQRAPWCSEHLLLPQAELCTGHTAQRGACVYALEAQRKEPRGVFISTAKAGKENVQNSGPNLHEKLRNCHHYSLMYNIA